MVINIHNLIAGAIQHNPSWSLPVPGYIFACELYTEAGRGGTASKSLD